MSLLEYKEWIISCSSCLTSACTPRVSLVVADLPFLPLLTNKVEQEMGMGAAGFKGKGVPSMPFDRLRANELREYVLTDT